MSEEYICEDCGKSYKSRSGLWKHQKKLGHGSFSEKIGTEEGYSGTPDDPVQASTSSETISPVEETVRLPTSSSDATDDPPQDTHSPKWMSFDFGSDESTDTIPTAFKSILTPVPAGSGKLSKAQAQALENQNKGILKMMLSTGDVLLSKYGQAVSLDPDFEVRHSEADKDLVANAQYRWMEEKGFFLTNYISSGMIAGGLTVHYFGAPIIRIRRKAKKKLFKGRGLLARLPLIGRLFRRKQEIPDIGQSSEVSLNEA